MKSLGIDIGSSSVKVSLLDIASGECAASSANPATEMPIGIGRRAAGPNRTPKCGGITSAKAFGPLRRRALQ